MPFAEAWNGTSWSIQATPNVNGQPTGLGSVSCTSATLCTATGRSQSGLGAPAAERWNGTNWSVQQVPAPQTTTGAGLNGVSCATASACTAVGSDDAAGDGRPGRLQRAPARQRVVCPGRRVHGRG
jgi:hypothetical protein